MEEGCTTEENQNDKCDDDETETDVENSEEIADKPVVEKSLLDEDEDEEEDEEESKDSNPTSNLDEKKIEELEEGETESEPRNELEDQAEEEIGHADSHDDEYKMLGAEIVFETNSDVSAAYNGWDNLRWLSLSGVRKIVAAVPVFRYFEGRRGFLWNKDEYVPRKIAVYEDPDIILILRDSNLDAKFDEENALKSHLVVESVIDPKTTKIRLSPLTTATSIVPNLSSDCPRRRSTFELISPSESIVLSAVRQRKNVDVPSYVDAEAFLETTEVEYLLTKAICSAQEHTAVESDFSWKHQIILGTLQSYIVLGQQDSLDKGIHQALRTKNGQSHLDMAIQQASEKMNPRFLNPKIIDAFDESGKTALHYACESRFSSAVISLVKAGADVNIRLESTNMTPCHIAAQNLDFKSLEAILGVSRRPNEVDDLGRSPMYLAITEGRTVGGQRDPKALERCIATLAKYGGQVGELMENRHPVSYLAYMCQPDEVEIVLKYSQYKFPLHTTKEDHLGISLSALYEYPLHSALISLKHRLQNLTIGGCPDTQQIWKECAGLDSEVMRTLKVLFSFGFEPNERIEGLPKSFREMEDLLEYVGFCPTQILTASVLELSSQRKVLGEELYAFINDMLANIMACLSFHGARVFPDVPPLLRSEERKSSMENIKVEPGADSTKRGEVKIQGNIDVQLFVGRAKVVEAQSYFKNLKSVPPPSNSVLHDTKANIENSMAPGGSDEGSCSICWKKFGFISRKHRCRISRRFVCDECSSRRVIVNGIEYRVSDGQFLLSKAEEMKEVQRKLDALAAQNKQKKQQAKLKGLTNRLNQMEAEENANRDSLFSGMANVAKSLGLVENSKEKEKAQSEGDTLSGLSNQLNQTRDALNERGAKLSTLSDKSDKLVSASQDFAAMAKELNRTSSEGFFSGW